MWEEGAVYVTFHHQGCQLAFNQMEYLEPFLLHVKDREDHLDPLETLHGDPTEDLPLGLHQAQVAQNLGLDPRDPLDPGLDLPDQKEAEMNSKCHWLI